MVQLEGRARIENSLHVLRTSHDAERPRRLIGTAEHALVMTNHLTHRVSGVPCKALYNDSRPLANDNNLLCFRVPVCAEVLKYFDSNQCFYFLKKHAELVCG